MASSLPSFCSLSEQLFRPKLRKYPKVIRYQIFCYEGNSANNIVDANLNVSRGRIEELKKKKERTLDSSCSKLSGWSNKSAGGFQKRSDILAESIEVLGTIISAMGLVFLSGSLSIFLFYFLVHCHT
ncbi:hypothetical protein LguiB_017789 [Lonicera macranthoides]